MHGSLQYLQLIFTGTAIWSPQEYAYLDRIDVDI